MIIIDFLGGFKASSDAGPQFANCSDVSLAAIRQYEQDFLIDLKRSSTFNKTGNGGFIESCLEHVAAQGYKSNIIQINGVTMAKALSDWWDEDVATEGDDDTAREIHWHMPCDLHLSSPGQCNPSCQAAGSTTTVTPLPVTKLIQ